MNEFGSTVTLVESKLGEKEFMDVPINCIPCMFVPMVDVFNVAAEDGSLFGLLDILRYVASEYVFGGAQLGLACWERE